MPSVITNQNTTSVINATDGNGGLKPDAFFDLMLLKMLRQVRFFFTKYGVEKKLPRNYGDTINWRRFIKLAPNTTPLTEGVTPDGLLISGLSLTAVIAQYGDILYFTDVVDSEQLDDVKKEYTVELGFLAQETLDIIARDILVAEGSAFFAGGKASAVLLDAPDIPDIDDFRKIGMAMKKAFIKGLRKEGMRYVALVSPEVMFDLIDDQKMQDYMNFGQTNKPLVDNIAFSMFGIRWIEVLNAPVLLNSGVGSAFTVHQSIVIGEQAYAVTKLDGAGVQIIHKALGSAGTEDGVNQRQSIAWKIMGYTVKVLNTEAVVVYSSIPTNQ